VKVAASHIAVASDVRDKQNAFALACFRALGSGADGDCPWHAVPDWPRAMQTLEGHGLLPLLGQAKFSGVMVLPDDVRQRVLKHTLRTALYQSNALDALNDIGRAMDAAGVPYAVLKGPYLYELLYRDLFPRAYGDIDLLVPADRIPDAMLALGKAGYDSGAKQGGQMPMPRWHFHAELRSNKPGGLPLELHRTLVDRANLHRIHEAELFGRLSAYKARQGGFTVLAPEDQFLYLCLHVAKHGALNTIGLRAGYPAEWFCSPAAGNRLLWFLDIDRFLMQQMEHLDWAAIVERAQRWNIADEVRDCLRVLRLLQPESSADAALQRLGAEGAEPASQTGMVARLLRGRTCQHWTERSMRTHLVLCIRPIRAILVGRSLLPSPAALLRYHGKANRAWLLWLYLMHPCHMLRKMLRP